MAIEAEKNCPAPAEEYIAALRAADRLRREALGLPEAPGGKRPPMAYCYQPEAAKAA